MDLSERSVLLKGARGEAFLPRTNRDQDESEDCDGDGQDEEGGHIV